MFRSIFALGVISASVALISGCGKAIDPAVLALRTKYLLTEEPAGTLGIIEFREQLGESSQVQHEPDASSQPDGAAVEDPVQTEEKLDDPEYAEKGGEHDSHQHQGHEHDSGHPHAVEAGKEIAVVGRIGGKLNPWSEGIAGFWIVDNTKEESGDQAAHGGPEHDPDTCPFCKKGKDNPQALAIVQFEDEQGKLLNIDARKLFDISRNQTVVVRGRTSFDNLGNLVISASGLYIRE